MDTLPDEPENEQHLDGAGEEQAPAGSRLDKPPATAQVSDGDPQQLPPGYVPV